VRRLLGLEKNASYGEALSTAERIAPQPLTTAGRIVLAVGAAGVILAGVVFDRFEIAVIALLLGAAQTTVSGAYRRALAAKVRAIGH